MQQNRETCNELLQIGSQSHKNNSLIISWHKKNKLRNRYFFFVWLWEVWVFTGHGGRGNAASCRAHSLSSKLLVLLFFLFVLSGGFLPHVAEVRVGVGFGGKGLLSAAAGRQQLPFFGVPPLHPAVLEPDFHLTGQKEDGEQRKGKKKDGNSYVWRRLISAQKFSREKWKISAFQKFNICKKKTYIFRLIAETFWKKHFWSPKFKILWKKNNNSEIF